MVRASTGQTCAQAEQQMQRTSSCVTRSSSGMAPAGQFSAHWPQLMQISASVMGKNAKSGMAPRSPGIFESVFPALACASAFRPYSFNSFASSASGRAWLTVGMSVCSATAATAATGLKPRAFARSFMDQ